MSMVGRKFNYSKNNNKCYSGKIYTPSFEGVFIIKKNNKEVNIDGKYINLRGL